MSNAEKRVRCGKLITIVDGVVMSMFLRNVPIETVSAQQHTNRHFIERTKNTLLVRQGHLPANAEQFAIAKISNAKKQKNLKEPYKMQVVQVDGTEYRLIITPQERKRLERLTTIYDMVDVDLLAYMFSFADYMAKTRILDKI